MIHQIFKRAGRFVLPVVAVAALATSLPAAAQKNLKVGVVNIPKVLLTSPQFKQAKESMESKFSKRKEELEAKAEQVREDAERLKRDGPAMSQSAREKLGEKITDGQRYLRVQQEEYSEDVQRMEKKEMEAIREDIFEVITELAKRDKFDLILAEGIVYADERIDVTDSVVELLKKKK